MMTVETKSDSNDDLIYLIDQIRSNLDTNETMKETPRAHAWLLTTLSIYGDRYNVLMDLYHLFRQRNSYKLLSFIIEHILHRHTNEIDKDNYLQQEFQLIFTSSTNNLDNKTTFSYSHLHSLLLSSTRDKISSLLLRKWYNELEENLAFSLKSIEILDQCREKALICLSLSSSSISSIIQLIINTEDKIYSNQNHTSLNIFRCLVVKDLLPIVLTSNQIFNIQSHLCHKWMISAIEFYTEYLIKSFHNNQINLFHIKLDLNSNKTFQCDNPMEQMEKLLNLSIKQQQNFNWHTFLVHHAHEIRSTNHRQILLELRSLIERAHNSTIRCPLECFIYCTSFPLYIQSIIDLSKVLNNDNYKNYLFLYSTSSLKTISNKQNNIDLIENFGLFVECLHLLQYNQAFSCLKLYHETLEKINLTSNISIYKRLLKYFYYYYIISNEKKVNEDKTSDKTVLIDDTPQSPTMQDDTNHDINTSPLLSPSIENLIEQLNDKTLESRLQLCLLYSISHLPDKNQLTVSFCIDTLIYLHENYLSNNNIEQNLLTLSPDYCLTSCSYEICFSYLLDIILKHVKPTLILLQIEHSLPSKAIYPQDLLSTITPALLRYVYDEKLLRQLLKYIQITKTGDRRWLMSKNKRKLDHDDNQLSDEQFIEKIIQHFSHIKQWTNEQQYNTIYAYIIDERQILLQSL